MRPTLSVILSSPSSRPGAAYGRLGGRHGPSEDSDSLARVADSAAAWTAPYDDRSPHIAGFFDAGLGVRLHYLDWSGPGDTIVMLTGYGLSAHIYDDLAPKLTDHYRVVALTRGRESDHPDGGYGIETAVEDIRRLLGPPRRTPSYPCGPFPWRMGDLPLRCAVSRAHSTAYLP